MVLTCLENPLLPRIFKAIDFITPLIEKVWIKFNLFKRHN